jgi:hypothetical protein
LIEIYAGEDEAQFQAWQPDIPIKRGPPTPTTAGALEKARKFNNLGPLSRLMRERRDLLTDEAYQFIADVLTGAWKPKMGRPKKTFEQRETPARWAAELVPQMKAVLVKYYSHLSRGEAETKAIELCSRKLGIGIETIRNILRRPKRDRRRRH